MVLSYNEVKKLGINLKIEEIESDFFQLGHEVEEVISINNSKLVIGEIKEVKKHENADKLNVCKVDVGDKELQIVCGAKNVKEGLKVIVALEGALILGTKISKVKLKGVESNGMICSLEELGFDKKNLTKEDIEGIHEIYEKVNPGDLAMKVLGLEDYILDLFITANRGDCQSYRGLYNDIRALINYKNDNNDLDLYNVDIEGKFLETIENNYKLEVEDGCGYFTARVIKDIEIKKSNWNTKIFLLKNGFKSQNFVTDISNEALLKYGIPSHIYDADKIIGKLEVKKLEQEENFVGLDESEVTLSKGTLVIKDEEKIVCVAGVMGSYETRVTEKTKNLLIEVASFDSALVFNSAKQIRKTEASLRYEKKVDTTIIDNVMTYICNEITKNEPNSKVSSAICVGNNEIIREEVELKYVNLKKILGIDISKEEACKILEKLNFKYKEIEGGVKAVAPSYRYDIEAENDLIEEIIRIYNIDNIEIDNNIVSFTNIDKVIPNSLYDNLRYIENVLLQENLNQIVTYSLVNQKMLNSFLGKDSDSVKLMYPLSSENEYYRQSLIPSLIKVCKENYSYQEKSIDFFEISKTYTKSSEQILEKNILGIILSGEFDNYYMGNKRKYNFFDLKSKIESLLDKLSIEYRFEISNDIEELNPYAQAKIYACDTEIGFLGEVVFDYDKKIKEQMFVAQIELDGILEHLENKNIKKYENISFLPKITRDLTLEVPLEHTYEDVVCLFDNINYLKDILLLDIYTGEHINDDKKSMTFRFTFQNEEETLTGEQIDSQMSKIFESSENKGYVVSGK